MRVLILHVDYFKTVLTDKSRSRVLEEVTDKVVVAEEALVVLSSVEKDDEQDPESVVAKAVEEIARWAEQLKVKTLVLHSFAHLFAELSSAEIGIEILKGVQRELGARGYTVYRTPFGWFNTLELKAKGHPLSRIARIISV